MSLGTYLRLKTPFLPIADQKNQQCRPKKCGTKYDLIEIDLTEQQHEIYQRGLMSSDLNRLIKIKLKHGLFQFFDFNIFEFDFHWRPDVKLKSQYTGVFCFVGLVVSEFN